MLQLNENLTKISESATISLADRIRQLNAQGHNIVGLQTGDPDFHTPMPIIEAAYQALRDGNTHYANSRGIPELRKAMAARIERVCGASYSADSEILVTHGAVHAYHIGLTAILNPGDAVLVPDPSWPTHANMVRLLRGVVVRVAASPENGFWPTMAAWEAALTPQTRALVICTPNNPTGMVANHHYLMQLNDFAARNNLYIISDEVYDNLLYDGARHVSMAGMPGAKERTLLVNSLSKTYAMTGWRVGYLAAPAPIINQALKASQHTITNVAQFNQIAAVYALTNPDMQKATADMVKAYARRRDKVLALWEEYSPTRVQVQAPQGAFYFFIDVREIGLSSMEVAERLIEEARVAVVPGSAYGPSGEGFLRMTIAASDEDIETGFRAILDWANKL